MIYRILKIIVKLGIRLYYSEVKVRMQETLSHKGSTILISNHPNALMDALIIGTSVSQPIYYMTKATFFNTKWKMKLLRSLNMIPINRASESKTKGINNASILEECYKLLSEGKILVIFPEGDSFMEMLLRPLKTGTARIALEAEQRNHGQLNLKVIPVGLMYTQGEKFRSSVMVTFGRGIYVTDYLETFKKNHSIAARQLTDKFRIILQDVLVTVQSKEHETLVTELSKLLHSKYIDNAHNVESEIELIKKIRDRIEVLSQTNTEKLEQIRSLCWELKWKSKKMNIKNDFLDRRMRFGMFLRQIFTSVIGLLIGSPLFLFGLIHNIIPYLITDSIIRKLQIDKEFYVPVAIAFSTIFYPLNYIFWIYSVNYFISLSTFSAICYLVSMPIMGFFAYYFARYLQHISYKISYTLLIKKNKVAIIEMKKQRRTLFQLIFNE